MLADAVRFQDQGGQPLRDFPLLHARPERDRSSRRTQSALVGTRAEELRFRFSR